MICIYKIINLKNNKVYIGQTINFQNRIIKHLRELRHNVHCNKHLQAAWNKYGENNFKFKIIKKCKKEELNDLEIKYIKKYKDLKKCYNNHKGGSFENIEKISEKLKKHIVSAKTKLKISQANKGKSSPMKGKHHTEEAKRKISEANKGKPSYWKGKKRGPQTLEHKMKNSLCHKGKKMSQESKDKRSKKMLGRHYQTIESKEKIGKAKKGTIWINNGFINKRIKKEDFIKYKLNDFKEGRIKWK